MSRTSEKPSIFISYRHADAIADVGRIAEHLGKKLWPDVEVFRDIESIPHGEDFDTAIGKSMAKTAILIVAIGPNWLDARDAAGTRRLDDPGDTVRREIAAAIEFGIPIIPVLLENAKELKREDLPDDIRSLAGRKMLRLNQEGWFFGITDLTKRVDSILSEKLGIGFKISKYAGIAIAFLSAIAWSAMPLVQIQFGHRARIAPPDDVMGRLQSGLSGIDPFRDIASGLDTPMSGVVMGYSTVQGWVIFSLIILYGLASVLFVTRPFRWLFSILAFIITAGIFLSLGDSSQAMFLIKTWAAPGLYVLTLLLASAVFESVGGLKTLRHAAAPSEPGRRVDEPPVVDPKSWTAG